MFKIIVIPALLITFLFTSQSCSSSLSSPFKRNKTMVDFGHRFHNNTTNRATAYKRYVKYKKRAKFLATKD